jgi:FAD/FMN-containing dehydrogenase
MAELDEFIRHIEDSFPDDRLTWQKAIATFHPQSADEAAAMLRLANEHRRPVFITGFGNNVDPIGEPFTDMVTIRTDRLNRLETVSPEDLYVTVGAGFPLKELNRHLETHELFAPHADLPYVGSVGGAVATNLSGRLAEHDVPLRRFLVKATIVLPTGEIITPGSVCFKSVSGYDIVKIFAPSWGLLGLLVSVSLRIIPAAARPEYAAMKMEPVDREAFAAALDPSCSDPDSIYSQKIKRKFDPNNVLPMV